MKRLRSYGEGLDDVSDKGVCRDWGRRDQEFDRPSSHRRFYSKQESGRKGSYDRSLDDDRGALRSSRKRFDHDHDGFDRRKGLDRTFDHECEGFDRRRGFDRSFDHESEGFDRRKCFDRYDRMVLVSSPRNADRLYRTESFSRREFPKGFRSERDRPRREESSSVSSWRRAIGNVKETDEELRSGVEWGRGKRIGSEDRGSSRSSPGSKEVGKSGSEDRGSARSSPWSKEVGKSPQWSKESGGEPSKSPEVEKTEAVNDESGSSSEMEEGELEPDPKPETELQPETQDEHEPNKCETGLEMNLVKEAESFDMVNLGADGNGECEKQEDKMLEAVTDVDNENDKVVCHRDDALNEDGERIQSAEASGSGQKEENAEECVNVPFPALEREDIPSDETNEEKHLDSPLPAEEEQRQENGVDVEVKEGDTSLPDSNKGDAEESSTPEVTLKLMSDNLIDISKDKGKSPVVSPSPDGKCVVEGRWMERDLLNHKDDATEGPSSRAFEFFCSDVKRPEKINSSSVNQHKDEKIKMEPLELSLGLPNVSLTLASHDTNVPDHGPNSLTRARSVHSIPTTLHTSSDGFSRSISFSGSQTFFHNPSCSLTQNSFENYEQSVGSHPLFQGVDQVSQGGWQGQPSNEPKHKEIPLYQRPLQNGNGPLHASQESQGILIGQAVQGPYLKVSEAGTGKPNSLNRQLSLSRQSSGQLRHEEVRSPAYSAGSRETRSEHSKDRKWVTKERSSGSVIRTCQKEMEQLILTGNGVAERIISKVVSDPTQIMARAIQEMTERSVEYIKELVCEILQKQDKSGQLHALQEALKRRTDLTIGTLTNCHQAQLEILVALKTGLPEYLQQMKHIPSADLIEIFLNLKCRNIACQSILDECDCKICAKKNGFCSACMCLVCSKFDLASNTCSWAGCDVCLHWCHTDCGLRESLIRNGTGTQGTTEMQFHCVACGHPSEMFGFVKEVFRTCAKDWNAETLSKELEYVKRIFRTSADIRGRQLHDVATQMLEKLKFTSNLSEVYSGVMMFLTESDSKFGSTSSTHSVKEHSQKNTREGNNGTVGPSQEASWQRSVSAEKAKAPHKEVGAAFPNLDWDRVERGSGFPELQLNVEKMPVVDELERIVRIKQAEATMFQARADDARQEAEGLKRIAIAKNEKIEEEYKCRIKKLHLVEAEARRRQKLEELQALERAHHEYSNMKKKMEADIKDLLFKMEATKYNLSA